MKILESITCVESVIVSVAIFESRIVCLAVSFVVFVAVAKAEAAWWRNVGSKVSASEAVVERSFSTSLFKVFLFAHDNYGGWSVLVINEFATQLLVDILPVDILHLYMTNLKYQIFQKKFLRTLFGILFISLLRFAIKSSNVFGRGL